MFEVSNSIYHNLDEKEQLILEKYQVKFFKFNGLEIPFSPLWKKIAINLSGGADSTCLTFLLCKIIEEQSYDCKIDVITHVRCWETRPWQQPISLLVFNKLKELYPNIINNRNENFIAPELEHGVTGYIYKDIRFNKDRSGDQLQVNSYNNYCAYKNGYSAVFNATSANPPGTDFSKKMQDRDKSAEEGSITDLLMSSEGKFLSHPFRFVNKAWIIAQYYYYGLTDLLETTRSCEGDVTHKVIKQVVSNYKEYSPGIKVPECNTCFWCLERNWAFTKLTETLDNLNE
jgi:hypothetical protein